MRDYKPLISKARARIAIALVISTIYALIGVWAAEVVFGPSGAFQLVGTAMTAPPTGTPDAAIIHTTELTALQYATVLDGLSHSIHISGDFYRMMEAAEYVQVDGHYYGVEITPEITENYFESLRNTAKYLVFIIPMLTLTITAGSLVFASE